MAAGSACLALVTFVAAAELLPRGAAGVLPVRSRGGPLLLATDDRAFLRLALLAVAATVVSGLGALAAAARLRITGLRWSRRLVPIALLGLAAGLVRYGIVALVTPGALPLAVETSALAVATLEMVAVLALACWAVDGRRRIRAEERRAAEARFELEQEEVRIRRDVSRRLHGGLQQRLVVAASELDAIGRRLDEHGDTGAARSVADVSRSLDETREHDVRALAHALYPLAVDIDLPAAILLLGDQLPAHVRLRTDVRPAAHEIEAALPAADRMYLFGVVEEATTNAIRHGAAGSVRVTLDAETPPATGRPAVVLAVDNDGAPLAGDVTMSGLAVLRRRVESRGGTLTLEPSPLGGARVTVRLPPAVDPSAPEQEP